MASASVASRLALFQALWAMERLGETESSLAEKFDRVAAAKFDGMAIDLGALTWEQARATIPHFSRTGLSACLTAFPTSSDDLRRDLGLAQEIGAPFMVVIGQDMPIELGGMIKVIEQWLKIADSCGMPIQFETHRNCITNDLFATVQLLDAVPEMRLAADLSHYVVDREMPCPPTAQLAAMISKILQHSDSFQGRVAARGQIQLPLDFAHNAKWVRLFKDWWREGFSSWRTRHSQTETMVFACELGPPDYALTDRHGREMSDRWTESLQLAEWARAIWQEVGGTL
jgi:hypothetical protein